MWHDVKIKIALNGYVVQVGCQTLVYDSRKKLILDLAEYLDDPEKKAKEMQETGINRQWTEASPGTTAPPPTWDGNPTTSPGFVFGTIDARV